MSFRENILKKIKIDDLTGRVLATLGPPGSEKKVDKSAMRELLDMNGYTFQRERDLDLHIRTDAPGKNLIVVMDNELALYNTTVADVAMRKSPTVKEMVSIRNAIKILKDTDVVVSRREETVRSIQQACLETLDFTYEETDIQAMGEDGKAALENGYADGVLDILKLFFEILGYQPLPKPLTIPHFQMAGKPGRKTSGEVTYSPVVIYSMMHNKLMLLDDAIGVRDKGNAETLHAVARGGKNAAVEGPEVFERLMQMFLRSAREENTVYRLKTT